MVKDFHMGDGNNASFYAGVLISAFSLAEALTGMFWGGLSDRLGRKPILLSGSMGTMVSLILVGLAPNFWVAVAGRALGGALNGNIGVIQTMVGELVKRPEHEPIGGLCARPAEGFPSLFPADGLFGKFPYLLPNLVCSILLLLSIISSWLLLEETHPDMQPGIFHEHSDHAAEHAHLVTSGATANASADLRAESYGTFNQVHLHTDESWNVQFDGSSPAWKKTPKPKAFTWRVTMFVIALAIFTYHSMTYDHLLPIFLQDTKLGDFPSSNHSLLNIPGGVGLSTRTVGVIMSTDGIIALVIQSIVFPVLAHYLGIWRLFIVVTVLHPIAYFMVPFLVFLSGPLVYIGIFTCLIVRNTLSIIDYPILLILIKQASPSASVMGKINGFAASAGAASRTLAPPIAGLLYSTGAKIGCTALAWWGSSLVALIGTLQLWFIQRNIHTTASVSSAAAFPYVAVPEQHHNDVVHIIVSGEDEAHAGTDAVSH
ncbi:uncharacterized protein N7515_009171 [Penicillium bovifimosum]|uniref:Major facilitator superfamily (MFS) profile domain-containing protein n=1 Tax=Penicillium bovifimosum TaxID=126998 RepID=A0A9W9GJ32_9EURO|nr:uncharacterized protein N7515_009171 [Penicillium bovifimosum]KAJ5121210.1 hypothetical protein N7515_009171 [Penicillium bovifimosum]